MQTLFVLAVVLAAAYASDDASYGNNAYGGYGHGYGHGGYGHGYGRGYGYGVYPDQHNAKRQAYVNKIAEKAGTGTGTAGEDGVPGTFLDKNHPTGGYPGYAGAAHVHTNYNRGYQGYGRGYGYGGYNGYVNAAH